MQPEHELVREWLIKAQHDLASAERLLIGQDPLRDTGCFHCQQTVEKAFKAFLTYHGIEFQKSHSLVYLLDLCARIEAAFMTLRDVASGLTVYAVGIRYPGAFFEPEAEEASEALAMARWAWQFVLQRLPDVVHP